MPETSLSNWKSSSELTSTFRPRPSALDWHTAMVCGWHLSCRAAAKLYNGSASKIYIGLASALGN